MLPGGWDDQDSVFGLSLSGTTKPTTFRFSRNGRSRRSGFPEIGLHGISFSKRNHVFKVMVWLRRFFGTTIFRCYPDGSGWFDPGQEWQLTTEYSRCSLKLISMHHEWARPGHHGHRYEQAVPMPLTQYSAAEKKNDLRVQKYAPKFVLVRRLHFIKHKVNSWRDLPI